MSNERLERIKELKRRLNNVDYSESDPEIEEIMAELKQYEIYGVKSDWQQEDAESRAETICDFVMGAIEIMGSEFQLMVVKLLTEKLKEHRFKY